MEKKHPESGEGDNKAPAGGSPPTDPTKSTSAPRGTFTLVRITRDESDEELADLAKRMFKALGGESPLPPTTP